MAQDENGASCLLINGNHYGTRITNNNFNGPILLSIGSGATNKNGDWAVYRADRRTRPWSSIPVAYARAA
jgi:hypothetical protein